MDAFDRGEAALKRRDVDLLMATATKHYVRQHVWLPIAFERSQQLNRPIKYFTLTTSDLYDIKVLERKNIIEKTGRGYPGVGFCESNDREFDEISRKLQRCSWSYKGDFEEMVSDHPHFEQEFVFDVVNLDFILVPFPGRESPLEGTWGAIRKLLQVQWEKEGRVRPFPDISWKPGRNQQRRHYLTSQNYSRKTWRTDEVLKSFILELDMMTLSSS